MTLFHNNNSPTNKKNINSCCKGKVIRISDISDDIISTGILGDGYGVVPESPEIYSPVSGRIIDITSSGFGLLIRTDDGLKVLVHFGCSMPAEMKKYVDIKANKGDLVNQSDLIADLDLEQLSLNVRDFIVCIIVTNNDNLTSFESLPGYSDDCQYIAVKYSI